jgi:hypothetical protein
MNETTLAEERLIKTVLISLPNYRPGWSASVGPAYSSAGGPTELSPLQKYVLVVAMIVGAEAIEWMCGVLLGPPTTFVGLLIAVLFSSRFLGAGPAWFCAALAAMNLAYDVPMDGRYVGTISAYLAILIIVRQGSFGGLARFRRALRRWSPNSLQDTLDHTKRFLKVSHPLFNQDVVDQCR